MASLTQTDYDFYLRKKLLMMFFLNLRKGPNQQELDNVFKLINGQDFASHTATKVAFSNTRKNLSHTSFIDLNYQIVDEFYQNKCLKKWRGHRLCAIDESQFRLPNEPDIVNAFGSAPTETQLKYVRIKSYQLK